MEERLIILVIAACLRLTAGLTGGMLYPRESESRQIQELNGMWNFRADTSATRDVGLKDNWSNQKLSQVGNIFCSWTPP